jgi:hypothetical protein
MSIGSHRHGVGWASMKSLSNPTHGLEPRAQQLRPLLRGFRFFSCGSVARSSKLSAPLRFVD